MHKSRNKLKNFFDSTKDGSVSEKKSTTNKWRNRFGNFTALNDNGG